MYHTVETPFRSGCHLTPPTVQTSPNNGLFFSFLIVFYSKKRQHTDRLQRINNIEEMNPPKKAKVLSSFRHFLHRPYGQVLTLFVFGGTGADGWSCRTVSHMTANPGSAVTGSRSRPFWPTRPSQQLYNQNKRKGKKAPFIFHKSLCIFHNIPLLSF